MPETNVETISFSIGVVASLVVSLVIFVSSLVGVWHKLTGKIKIMDLELTSSRNEVLKASLEMETTVKRLEKVDEENKNMLNGRIDASNSNIKSIQSELMTKIEGIKNEVHQMAIGNEKNKNEILEAIRNKS
jgi:uncharacterized protein Yka (UPF0111/DUF47 family)